MILLGEELDARAALACGLVSAVVPRADLEAHGRALAERIAAQGPIAVRYAKEAMRQGLDMPLEQALRYETDLTSSCRPPPTAPGVRAFLENGRPFEGAAKRWRTVGASAGPHHAERSEGSVVSRCRSFLVQNDDARPTDRRPVCRPGGIAEKIFAIWRDTVTSGQRTRLL
jgi:hypothetical protein